MREYLNFDTQIYTRIKAYSHIPAGTKKKSRKWNLVATYM